MPLPKYFGRDWVAHAAEAKAKYKLPEQRDSFLPAPLEFKEAIVALLSREG